eukprot:sb/3469682/
MEVRDVEDDWLMINFVKGLILSISGLSIGLSIYLNSLLELSPVLKLFLLFLSVMFIIFNIYNEEGIISDSCSIVALSYILLTLICTPVNRNIPPMKLPWVTDQAQTMLGAMLRIPQFISFSVSSAVPFAKELLSPLPLAILVVRVICVAAYSDKLLSDDSWLRGMGKFLVVTLYTSYVLGATNQTDWMEPFNTGCRILEIILLPVLYMLMLLADYTLEQEGYT